MSSPPPPNAALPEQRGGRCGSQLEAPAKVAEPRGLGRALTVLKAAFVRGLYGSTASAPRPSHELAAVMWPVSDGFTGIVRPAGPATVISVEPWTITSAGQPRRAGVRLNWSGAPEDAAGLSFQVWLAAEQQLVAEGRVEVVPGGSGNTIIGPLIPNTLHEVRARWCRACGWDAEARECTRAADLWQSIAERMDR